MELFERWKWVKRLISFLDRLAIIMVVPAILYIALPSSVFLEPQKTEVVGEQVIFTRFTPLGDVIARWQSEIVMLDGSDKECSSGNWAISVYQQRKSNAVTYRIGEWADECVTQNEKYALSTTRQVLLFGWLPLRPIHSIDTIEVPS